MAESNSSDSEDLKTIVIDSGTHMIRAGFGGDGSPRSVFPPIVGVPKEEKTVVGWKLRDTYVGDEARSQKTNIFDNTTKYPIQRGRVVNWDGMEKIWHHTFFNELRIDPSEYDVMLTETPLNTKDSRERMAQIMFENFDTAATFVANQAVLALLSSGRTNGIVFDCGDGVTSSVPIIDLELLPEGIYRQDFGGRDVTDHLVHVLGEKNSSLLTTEGRVTVEDIKAEHCYIAFDYDAESSAEPTNLQYTLPDGQTVNLGKEVFQSPEIMFKSSEDGSDHLAAHQVLHHSIMNCGEEYKKTLLNCPIMIVGGGSFFVGFKERMHKEISNITRTSVRVTAPPERKKSTWIGGSILAELSQFQSSWMTKSEYQEFGASLIHRKGLPPISG